MHSSMLCDVMHNSMLPALVPLQTDVHHGILSLLLFLSDSPSNAHYTETPRVKEAGELPDCWLLLSGVLTPHNPSGFSHLCRKRRHL